MLLVDLACDFVYFGYSICFSTLWEDIGGKQMQDTEFVLRGGVDLHTHCGPDFYPRSVDQIELTENANKEKMAAVVFKNHFCPTYFAAQQAAKQVPGIRVFGGLVLNNYVGGLNVDAVDLAVKAGAKIIWMPTLSAANHFAYYGVSNSKGQKAKMPLRQKGSGLTICESGRLKPEVFEILEVIADRDAIVATGHISNPEALVLVREAAACGLRRILITHPDSRVSAISETEQRELIRYGGIVEKCLLATMPGWGNLTIKQLADSIRRLGAENCVIVTDFGQAQHEIPTEGLKRFVRALFENGITPEEIQMMLCKNPCVLLGINE
jgi:hypothetical protein